MFLQIHRLIKVTKQLKQLCPKTTFRLIVILFALHHWTFFFVKYLTGCIDLIITRFIPQMYCNYVTTLLRIFLSQCKQITNSFD